MNGPLLFGTFVTGVSAFVCSYTLFSPGIPKHVRLLSGAVVVVGLLLMLYGAFFYQGDKVQKRGHSSRWEG